MAAIKIIRMNKKQIIKNNKILTQNGDIKSMKNVGQDMMFKSFRMIPTGTITKLSIIIRLLKLILLIASNMLIK